MFDSPPLLRASATGEGITSPQPGTRVESGATIALLGLLFALYGGWRAPVPGVNEPHYLCKARHFWEPQWCGRDLFLASSNPHWVFYASVGSLTRFLSLEQCAWAGRGLVWGALAFGWVALARQIVPGRWGPLWSAAIFAGLSATGNLSGEWLIGGVEAKGFAYAALFLALADACRGRGMRAAAWCGAAVSFHPVVGVWGAVALAFTRVWQLTVEPRQASGGVHPPRPTFARSFAPLLVGALFSLPGLIPALAIVMSGAPPEVARAADELQVFQRLVHHLDPTHFKRVGWILYAALLAGWLATRPWRADDAARRLFFRFVVGTLLIAAGGMGVGFGPRWAWALKFYPFRLADLFLPIAVAFAAARWLVTLESADGRRSLSEGDVGPGDDSKTRAGTHHSAITANRSPRTVHGGDARPETVAPPTPALPPQGGEGERRFVEQGAATCTRESMNAMGHLIASLAFVWALVAPGADRNPTGWTPRQNADWLDVCQWIARETPADALCLTPRFRNYTFKWNAGRAEYAIWKDCPQDATSLIEWKRRLELVRHWRGRHYETGYTAAAIEELRDATEVDYIVDWYVQPYRVEPVYRNASFRVYQASQPSKRH